MRIKTVFVGLSIMLAPVFARAAWAADPPKPVTMDLWPAQPPGDARPIAEEKLTRKSADAPGHIDHQRLQTDHHRLPARAGEGKRGGDRDLSRRGVHQSRLGARGVSKSRAG